MPKVVRVGDSGSHGGQIVTGSPTLRADAQAVARVGDTYNCPEHGPNPIVEGSPTLRAEGRAVARVGDRTACGATLTTGSPTATLDGRD
ncbi:PAAR domain-containing protein [Adonisia turfae]